MSIILFLIVFVILLVFLNKLARQHTQYSKRVFIGLGLGILLGAAIQFLLGADSNATTTLVSWIDIVGRVYIKFLQMLVVPLIFVSLVTAFTQMKGKNKIGQMTGHILSVLLITVAISAFLGLAVVFLFHLDGTTFTKGSAELARISELTESNAGIADLTLPQQIISLFPSNIFEDFAGLRPTSTISVVIFSAITGIAYLGIASKHPDEALTFKKIIDALHVIVMRMVTLVLRMAPYGIMALMAKMVATSSFASLIQMGGFLIAGYAAFIVMFIIHGIILAMNGLSPITYFKKVLPVLTFAFTSRSSGASVPLNIEAQTNELGVDSTIANFSASLGLSIGQNGCAGIYPAMLVALVAPMHGFDFSQPMTWLTIIATIVVSSIGVAGVGGGATFASLIVFGTLGLPIEIIGLMVSIEPVIDMGRTALNVNDSMVAGVVTAKQMNQLDTLQYSQV